MSYLKILLINSRPDNDKLNNERRSTLEVCRYNLCVDLETHQHVLHAGHGVPLSASPHQDIHTRYGQGKHHPGQYPQAIVRVVISEQMEAQEDVGQTIKKSNDQLYHQICTPDVLHY